MLCEKCGNKQAVMKIYENINNEKKTQYICEDCAMEMMGSHLSFGGMDPFSAFSGFFQTPARKETETVCPSCGMTFRRFLDWGKFGCAHCYEAFGDQLEPVFKKFHFRTEYKGKHPEDAPVRLKSEGFSAEETKTESPSFRLEQQLKDAVAKEDYETAAVLKKQIDQMQEGSCDE